MLLDIFTEQYNRIHQVLSRQIFFIVGAQKSGTTWLQRILDAHPQIVCSGEGHFIDDLSLNMSSLIQKYNQKLLLVADRVYEGNPYYLPFTQNEFDFLSVAAMAIMLSKRSISEETLCIGDKTPVNILHVDSFIRLFPEAKYIHIVRDGRDVVVSHYKHIERVVKTKNLKDYKLSSFKESLPELSKKWSLFVEKGAEAAKKLPSKQFQLIRYEDLKQQPDNHIQRLFQFLGVNDSLELVKSCQEKTSFESLTKRKAGEEKMDSFLRKGIVGDWQNHFDAESLQIFEQYGGKWLNYYGYR